MTVLFAAAEGSHLAGDLSVVAVGVVCLIAMDTIWQSIKEHRAAEREAQERERRAGTAPSPCPKWRASAQRSGGLSPTGRRPPRSLKDAS